MKYRFSGYVAGSCGWNPPFYSIDNFNEIENELIKYPQISRNQFMVSWQLPGFTALVSKSLGFPDTIVLKKGESEIEIIRRTDAINAPVAAFCMNGADNADIHTEILNIAFRPIDDHFVNKGLVWIWLDLQEASVVFTEVVLQEKGLLGKIVYEAEQAIQKELLDVFDP